MNKQFRDLTQGPIYSQLTLFALPLLASSLIQLMYSTVDMIFVGRILGSSAAAAIGSSSMIINCVIGFFVGLSVGAGVVAGKAIGARNKEKLKRIINSIIPFTFLLSGILAALGIVLAPRVLILMNTPMNIFDDAVIYIRIYFISLLSISLYNIGTGVIKALGDSKNPMYYQLVGGIANIIGNYFFLCVFKLGVVGASMTTLLSQSIAAMLVLRSLGKLPDDYKFKLRNTYFDLVVIEEILSIGVPAAIQAIVLSLSNVIVQSNINRLGVDSIAAFSVYYKAENLIYFPIMAIGQACSNFVSQNVGLKQFERAKEGTKASVFLGTAVTVTVAGLALVFINPLFSVFTDEISVISIGRSIARITFPFYFLYVFIEVYSSSIRGTGNALPTMAITIINMCFIRLAVLTFIVNNFGTASAVAAVYPITWLFSATMMYGYYRYSLNANCELISSKEFGGI